MPQAPEIQTPTCKYNDLKPGDVVFWLKHFPESDQPYYDHMGVVGDRDLNGAQKWIHVNNDPQASGLFETLLKQTVPAKEDPEGTTISYSVLRCNDPLLATRAIEIFRTWYGLSYDHQRLSRKLLLEAFLPELESEQSETPKDPNSQRQLNLYRMIKFTARTKAQLMPYKPSLFSASGEMHYRSITCSGILHAFQVAELWNRVNADHMGISNKYADLSQLPKDAAWAAQYASLIKSELRKTDHDLAEAIINYMKFREPECDYDEDAEISMRTFPELLAQIYSAFKQEKLSKKDLWQLSCWALHNKTAVLTKHAIDLTSIETLEERKLLALITELVEAIHANKVQRQTAKPAILMANPELLENLDHFEFQTAPINAKTASVTTIFRTLTKLDTWKNLGECVDMPSMADLKASKQLNTDLATQRTLQSAVKSTAEKLRSPQDNALTPTALTNSDENTPPAEVNVPLSPIPRLLFSDSPSKPLPPVPRSTPIKEAKTTNSAGMGNPDPHATVRRLGF